MMRGKQETSPLRRISNRLKTAGVAGSLALTVALAACSSPETVEAAPAPAVASATEATPAPDAQPTGFDVSFPQCNTQLPAQGAFAIVGVNEYLPTIENPCFDELADWAEGSTGGTSQPEIAVYATAANPGDQHVPTWPTSGSNEAYGECHGEDSQACAYEYGKDRIEADIETVKPRVAGALRWWIDVEPEYSWETGAEGMARNAAVLEGMVDTLQEQGSQVGIYSSPAIWQQIIGTMPAKSSLNGLDNWILGAHSEAEARANCEAKSFTDGKVEVAQWTTPNELDRDISCPRG